MPCEKSRPTASQRGRGPWKLQKGGQVLEEVERAHVSQDVRPPRTVLVLPTCGLATKLQRRRGDKAVPPPWLLDASLEAEDPTIG